MYNNIEITEHHYQPEYSSLNNGITYNLMVQPSEHPGIKLTPNHKVCTDYLRFSVLFSYKRFIKLNLFLTRISDINNINNI